MADLCSLARAVRVPALIVTAAFLGSRFPVPNDIAAATVPLVAFLVFAAVHDTDWRSFAAGTRPRFAVGALAAVYLLPLAFSPVPSALLDGPVRAGTVVVLAGPPTAGSAIVWSRLGGGDATATLLVTTGALALAPLATPAVLGLVLGRSVAVDPVPIGRTLALVVGGGICLSWVLPDGVVSESTLDASSLAVVAALVYVGIATTTVAGVTLSSLGAVALVAVGFLVFAGLLAAGSRALVSRERAVALFFATGLRNVGIGVAIATALPVQGAVVAVVTFYVVQQVVAAVAAEGLGGEPSLAVGPTASDT